MNKPLGIFTDAHNRPHWAQFALLPDWADFNAAAADSLRTGIKWVLGIYSPQPATPLSTMLPSLVARVASSNLRPHLAGMCYSEEWSGRWKSGQYPIPGLDHTNPQHLITGARAIAWWCSEQHKAMAAAFPGLPIVWIDTFVNDDPSFGGGYYQPVPWGVRVLGLEAYVSAGGTWASDVEPFLQHAVATRTEPITLIIQGFRALDDSTWQHGPTHDSLDGITRWMAHPRVISGWVFDWADRPGMVSFPHLPLRGQIEAAMGVRS